MRWWRGNVVARLALGRLAATMASRSETTAPPELRRLHEVQNRLTKARSDLRSSHASLRAEQSALARAKDQLSAKDEQLIQLQEKLQSRDDEAKIAAEQLIALRQDIDSHNSRSEVAALRIVELERDLQQERQRTAAAVARADKAQQELDESASGSDSVGADEVSQPLDEAQQVLDETAISVLSEPEASPGDHFQTAGRAAQSQAVETLQVAQEAQAKQRCAQEVSAIRSELVALRGLVCALRSEWMKLLPRAKRRLVKEIKLLNNPTAVSPPHARELQTHVSPPKLALAFTATPTDSSADCSAMAAILQRRVPYDYAGPAKSRAEWWPHTIWQTHYGRSNALFGDRPNPPGIRDSRRPG